MFFFKKRLSICAVIAARNEFQYLKILLPLLADQAIDVVIIDNESTDESRGLYSDFAGKPIVKVQALPYAGFVSLRKILLAKQDIFKNINYDWVIHHDADEIMEHRESGRTLRDAVEEADKAGYNALNFDEFVFLPEPDTDYSSKNYYTELLRYYFFEPKKNRLNRAWKRHSQLWNVASGGHKLQGKSLSIAPSNHILRHYIVLSEVHAREKYLHRSYDQVDLVMGLHGNRLNFTETSLALPGQNNFLFQLNRYNTKDFCKTNPVAKHFWEW